MSRARSPSHRGRSESPCADPLLAVSRRRPQAAVVLGAIAALAFCLLAVCVVTGASKGVDNRVALGLHGALREDEIVLAMRLVSAFGSAAVLVPLTVVVTVLLLVCNHAREAAAFALTTMSGRLAVWGFKELIDRPRPRFAEPLAVGYGWSFPSGHAAESLMVVGAIILVIRRPLTTYTRRAVLMIAAVAIGAIGFTRLALGVHYLTDVVAGWALGLLWLSAAALLLATRTFDRTDSEPSNPRWRRPP